MKISKYFIVRDTLIGTAEEIKSSNLEVNIGKNKSGSAFKKHIWGHEDQNLVAHDLTIETNSDLKHGTDEVYRKPRGEDVTFASEDGKPCERN